MTQRIKEALTQARYSLSVLLTLIAAGTVFAQETTTESRSLTDRILTLAETRPVAQIIVFALVALTLYSGALLLQSMRQRYPVTWRVSLRMAGWIIPLITIALVGVLILGNETGAKFGKNIIVPIIQLILPIAAAIHTALIFSPEDEPLEMLLALPRPITWLVFERVLIVILIYAGIGVMGMGLMAAQQKLDDIGVLLAAWIPSLLALVSFSLYLTVRTRVMMMGLVGALVMWCIFMLFNPFLMPGSPQPFPMNYVQPLLWMVNIFAQPAAFPENEYYTLNRLILLGLTVFWFWRTAAQLNDSETLLLSAQDRQSRRRAVSPVEVSPTKRPLKLQPAPVSINVLWQIAAMWLYETKLHWRRRPLKVVFLTLLLTTGISLLIAYDSLLKVSLAGAEMAQLPIDQQLLIKGLVFMRMSMSVLTVVQMLILPVILADSVALDETDHMRDMLHSMPLPGWAYLAGKIGGVWFACMTAITLACVILCGLWVLVVGAYNPLPIIDSWIIFSAPIVLFNSGFAMLIGATQPNRRRAIMVVMGAFFVSFYLGNRFTDGVLGALNLNPFNSSLLMRIFSDASSIPTSYAPIFSLLGVTDFLMGRGLVFLITALLIGIWWSWRWSGISLWPKARTTETPLPVQQGS